MVDEAPDAGQPLGMSRASMLVLGGVCAFFCAYMVYQASSGTLASPTGGYVFAAVLAVGSVGCVARGRVQGAALRAIGGVVLLACLAYLAGEVANGELVSERRSQPSVLNAIMALIVFGVPGAYVLVRGPHAISLTHRRTDR